MEIEIPTQLYELLLIEAANTGSAIEEIAEFCFRKFMDRSDNNDFAQPHEITQDEVEQDMGITFICF